MIDSIRKSLGIDNMDDVELLVMTFYEYSDRHKQEMKQMEEEQEHFSSNNDKTSKNATKKNQEEKKNQALDFGERASNINAEEEDENLEIDMDDVVDILKDFHKKREERANNAELVGNPRMKKRSNFETEE